MKTWSTHVIDPSDEAALRQHWEVGQEAERSRPYEMYWSWDACLAGARHPRTESTSTFISAHDDQGGMVGAGQVLLPMADNLSASYGEVFVLPSHRRRGVGRTVLDALEAYARHHDRRTMAIEAYVPTSGPPTALDFARATGYESALEEEVKTLELRAHQADWDALAAHAAAGHRDYHIETFLDRVPDEALPGYSRLRTAFSADVPVGDLEMQAQTWTPQRVREREERHARICRSVVTTVARDATGALVGLSEIGVDTATPWRAEQSGTLVLPEHRGHRLGLALKIANQRALLEAHPTCTTVFTDNAGDNAAMNAINEQVGFRTVERLVVVQKHL
ncbi:GNAT family N-acetyltransferase [Luteipulveratus sp. YIM 133132]|uniref:GNAT family N-acetyltransferase n=1 Tax=Luteipulveratus flavus TaxID=3031728 RepID=UPI0023B19528|nr:GNAT family N-acetyltransferase [Luteipulveratus sp. YIM 133132]MDE9364160.1 GNAT family N-acetyltransferase [Luteipulveratus sp. YIM 133132]